jgi:hypothetical protein
MDGTDQRLARKDRRLEMEGIIVSASDVQMFREPVPNLDQLWGYREAWEPL